MPYDVVFLLNSLFAALAEAVENCSGYYSNFTGDGLMALFGLDGRRTEGARAAMRCALVMCHSLDGLNERLAGEMEAPLEIGIGIHTGQAIVGRMGPPKTPIISAVGDSVNTAARLERTAKELDAPLVVSAETLQAAELSASPKLIQSVATRAHCNDASQCARRSKSSSDSDLVHSHTPMRSSVSSRGDLHPPARPALFIA